MAATSISNQQRFRAAQASAVSSVVTSNVMVSTGLMKAMAPRRPSIPTPGGLDPRAWADAVAEVERDCGCASVPVAGRVG